MKNTFTLYFSLLVTSAALMFTTGCSVEASKLTPEDLKNTQIADAAVSRRGATIEIEPNSPADTVRVFYKYLRERKFREAIFLTNIRPAVEGLTDAELKEFQVDFEAIAAIVPEEVQINGEIVSGDLATVTAKFPDEDDKLEIQEIKLRRSGNVWIILSADDEAEAKIKKDGKNYFYNLRIETKEIEAKAMLDRIVKAQMVFALQNKGAYGEIAQLVGAGFLPPDVQSTYSTGYKYSVQLSADKRSYSVTAEPAEYGKTGKQTFTVQLDEKRQPRLSGKDMGK